MHSDCTHTQQLIAYFTPASRLDDPRQHGRLWKGARRLRQVGVGGRIAAEQRSQTGHDLFEIQSVAKSQQPVAWTSTFQANHYTTRTRNPPDLGESLADIRHITHGEAGGDRVETGI